MNTLNSIWNSLLTFQLFFSLNVLAVVQYTWDGGIIDIGITFFSIDNQDGLLLIGIPIIAILNGLIIWLSFKYYYEVKTIHKTISSWQNLIPDLLGKGDLPPSISIIWSRLTIALMIIPHFIGIQQYYKFLNYGDKAIDRLTGTEYSIWMLQPPTIFFTDSFRYGNENGFSFWPFYIPLLYSLIELSITFYLATYFYEVFKNKKMN